MSNIEKREITSELSQSYLEYAISTIVSRALPDVRDGLKPVQRRILWDMWETGATSTAKFRKSAKVVGDTMGQYHPHGDSAIYDAMVRMTQDFSLRYPLIHGQGNFGSIDGDGAAAMRYTEAKLAKIADELLEDIDKETVEWGPNYDGSRDEPRVLPARLPNLLLNGTMGIAVGMATSIPPHNLGEVASAILHLSENPKATSEDLLEFIKGPDFPTGGIIFDKRAIKEAYVTGKGGITMRAKTDIAERKKGQFDIVITEIPYQVNKAELIKEMAILVTDKKIEGVRDIRDESDREGLRMVVELKNDAAPQKVLNQLFKHTNLQKDFHFNMIALVNSIEPRLLSVKEILSEYIEWRKVVVRRRAEFDLKKAKDRAHILEGLSKALSQIDKVIACIKKSEDRDDARANLMKQFKFTEIQANAILEMRLQTLANLEQEKIENELKEKLALIASLEALLKSPAKILKQVTDELKSLVERHGNPRKTQVVPTAIGEFREEDLVPEEEAIITLSAGGYVKRMSPDTFSAQHRGGKGLIGSGVGDDDFIEQSLRANTHNDILFFTDRGRTFQTKVYEIPVGSRTAKGRAIQNFLELTTGENISAIVSYSAKEAKQEMYLVMVTQSGVVKKTALEQFANIRRNGIIAINLQKGDLLKWVGVSHGKDEMIMTTAGGQSIRFKETNVRPMGRTAGGIRGMRIRSSDKVAGFDILKAAEKEEQKTARLLVVMENGFGKLTPLKEYKVQNRGGSGIKTANITAKTGKLISARVVTSETEIFALSQKGQIIRTQLESIRETGRAAQGVKIMNLAAGDKLATIVIL
jgi:DNA gyrase subunit A